MGLGGERTLRAAKKIARDVEREQPFPPSTGTGTQAFDRMPEPSPEVTALYDTLTPRDAAGAYLSVALGPLRDSEFARDAQKALAVIKTILVRLYFLLFSI